MNSSSPKEVRSKRPLSDIWNYATRQVSRREYTETTMRNLLSRKGYEPEPIQKTIQRLTELRLINDVRFAEISVRSLCHRGKGPRYISAWLRQKGIDCTPQKIDQMIAADPNEADAVARQKQRLQLKIQRKYPDWKTSYPDRQKAMAFLVRQGFAIEQARRLLEEQES